MAEDISSPRGTQRRVIETLGRIIRSTPPKLSKSKGIPYAHIELQLTLPAFAETIGQLQEMLSGIDPGEEVLLRLSIGSLISVAGIERRKGGA